ncbi:MAG: hypothetical protein PUF12_08005 [Thermoflexaceae bacterium]|nr:hypothetical protein [Thermoflexaceae bacterium]
MKRVKAACIVQTLHFMLKEEIAQEEAENLVKEEVAKYKEQLEHSGMAYKILSETVQADGSVIMELKKQYSTAPVGGYFD